VAVSLTGRFTVIGLVPTVCTKPEGKEPSTTATTEIQHELPLGNISRAPCQAERSASLSITATRTSSMPGSPGSWTPLLFRSSNTVPLIPPSGVLVGEFVAGAVGGVVTATGSAVGDSLGD